MDKQIYKQNPKTTLKCGNKDCNNEFIVKTTELCKGKKYSHICEKCGMSTEYDSSKMFDGVIKQLKALGGNSSLIGEGFGYLN